MKHLFWQNKIIFGIALVAFLLVFIQQRGSLGSKNFFKNDPAGYYSHLITPFIEKSWTVKDISIYPEQAWYFTPTSQGYVNKYPPGNAIFYLPFFLMGHTWAWLTGAPMNGTSSPYLAFMCLEPIFYLVLGLFFLKKVLENYFTEKNINWTLVSLGLATNLLIYSSTIGMMTHVHLFFLYALICYLTIRWYEKQKFYDLFLIGILVGWATITRPNAIVIIIIPFLFGLQKFHELKARLALFWSRKNQVMIAFLGFSLMLSILFIYWKVNTGQWIYYSYGNEGFDFSNPKILQGLFSFQNGLFIYSPFLMLSVVGFWWTNRYFRTWKWVIMVFFSVNLYITFSWWCWWYVGFGMRALIESYVLLAFPLCAFFTEIEQVNFKRMLTLFFLMCCVGLNLFQTFQYQRGIIYHQGMTWEAYKFVFGKINLSEEEKKQLNQLIRKN